MIIDGLFGLLLDGMGLLVGLLPTAAPLDLAGASGVWIGYAQFNSFLPLTEVLAGFGVLFGVEGLVMGYRFVRVLRDWLPFV